MKTESKIIEELVDENFVYARVLHYFGIHFYENRKKTLLTVCSENGIDSEKLDSILKGVNSTIKLESRELAGYPIILIVEYLKHAHQYFIKDKLPYILKLVNEIEGESRLIKDLKFILPMFVEDFIKHIYEEEDRLFNYILTLDGFLKNPKQIIGFGIEKNNFSIQEFALHHDDSDQEMKGIRGITYDYNTDEIENINLKVLFNELKHFDEQLTNHASIENQILFPKALSLEKSALSQIHKLSLQN